MTEVVFARERLQDTWREVLPLWHAHWMETEGYRHEQQYNPDLDQFAFLDTAGHLHEYTARLDGKLVGHIGYILYKGRHTSRMTAIEDWFYLAPEHRKGFLAMRLLRYAVGELKKHGCAEIGISSKLSNDIEPLLKRAGFEYVAKFYVMSVPENL